MPRSTDSGKLALWRERFERFSRGRLAVGPFCARERVSVASFYYWREKVGQVRCASDDGGKKIGEAGRVRQDRSQTDRRSVFQPVTVVPLDTTRTHSRSVAAKPCVASRVPGGSAELTAEAAAAVRIELPGGARIEVGTEDLEVVRAVVGVVARSDDGRHGSDGPC
jgi:hypothetical protein